MSTADKASGALARAARRVIDPRELRVAAVLDEASAACLGPECELIEVTSDGWREELEEREPHLLLVESAWAGTSGSWQYQVASYDHPDSAGLARLTELTGWCRDRDVPTVFWSNADPAYGERFRAAAGLFDRVFTTHGESVPTLATADGSEPPAVAVLPFAAAPALHNPSGAPDRRDSRPCWVGAFHAAARDPLLAPATALGLAIYEPLTRQPDGYEGFPDDLAAHVAGHPTYARAGLAYRAHAVALSAEPAPASPTMVARGAFEAAACGTAVVSTPSHGLGAVFGDLVTVVETPAATTAAIERVTEDEGRRSRITTAARRLVFAEHTYRHRLATIARAAGYQVSAEADRRVTAIMLVDELAEIARLGSLAEALARQSVPPVEVLVGLGRDDDAPEAELGPLDDLGQLTARIVRQDGALKRSERYAELAAIASSNWLAVVHPVHAYGRHHLGDLFATTRYVSADALGTATSPDAGAEHRFVAALHPHSALARRQLVTARGWQDERPADAADRASTFAAGIRSYAVGGGSFTSASTAAAGLGGRTAALSA